MLRRSKLKPKRWHPNNRWCPNGCGKRVYYDREMKEYYCPICGKKWDLEKLKNY